MSKKSSNVVSDNRLGENVNRRFVCIHGSLYDVVTRVCAAVYCNNCNSFVSVSECSLEAAGIFSYKKPLNLTSICAYSGKRHVFFCPKCGNGGCRVFLVDEVILGLSGVLDV